MSYQRAAAIVSVLLGVALGGCAAPKKEKEKAEDFGPRFEAASRIKDVETHDRVLVKIAGDAMAADNPGATSWAISQISAGHLRDDTAEKAADFYLKNGRKDVAGAIAENIVDDAKRDSVMQRLAEAPAVKRKEKR
jgi:hypothetical protein